MDEPRKGCQTPSRSVVLPYRQTRGQEAVEDAKKFKRTFQAVPQDRVVETMRQDAVAWISSLSDSERASLVKYTGNDAGKALVKAGPEVK